MKNDNISNVRRGDPVKADQQNKIIHAVKKVQAHQHGFVSGDVSITRRPIIGDRVYKLINCDDETDFLIVANDLAKHIDKVALVKGICYKIKNITSNDTCIEGVCVVVSAILETCEDCKESGGKCWLFTPCTTGSEWIGKGNFSAYEGLVVLWSDDLCYTVTISGTCNGSIPADPAAIKSSYPSCDECGQCTQLRSCLDGTTLRYVRTDQIALFPDASLVGRIMEVDGVCWEIMDIAYACPSDPEDLGSVYQGPYYDTCTDCGCHLFHGCSPGTVAGQAKHVNEAEWLDNLGVPTGNPFDLSELVIGDIVILGASDTSKECWEYQGKVVDCTDPVPEKIEVWEHRDNECDCCQGWHLIECTPGTREVWTQSDLCEYYDHVAGDMKANTVLKWANGLIPGDDGKCFDQMIRVDIDDPTAPNWEEFIVDSTHKTCDHCLTPRYKLTDAGCKKALCEGHCTDCGTSDADCESAGPLVTDDETLVDAVGQIIKYDGICWEVEETADVVDTPGPLAYDGPFADCQPCLEEPICISVVTNVFIDGGQLKQTVRKYVVKANLCESEDVDIVPVGPCP